MVPTAQFPSRLDYESIVGLSEDGKVGSGSGLVAGIKRKLELDSSADVHQPKRIRKTVLMTTGSKAPCHKPEVIDLTEPEAIDLTEPKIIDLTWMSDDD
jgi:hypothetical protein